MFSPNTCCVIGTGFLGIRITGELSRLGFSVNVYDHDPEQLRKVPRILQQQRNELLQRGLITDTENLQVNLCENLPDAVNNVEFIFEAVVENVDIKTWLLQKVTANCPSKAIIFSNTLKLRIEDIIHESLFKERIVGCRFMAPVYCIPLVELTTSKITTHDLVVQIDQFFNDIGYQVLRKGTEAKKLEPTDIDYYWNAQKRKIERLLQQRQHGNIAQESSLTSGSVYACPINNNDRIQTFNATQIDHAVGMHNQKTIDTLTRDMNRIELERQFPDCSNYHEKSKKQEDLVKKNVVETEESVIQNSGSSINSMIHTHNVQTEAGHVDMFQRNNVPENSSNKNVVSEVMNNSQRENEDIDTCERRDNVIAIDEMIAKHNICTEAGHGGLNIIDNNANSTEDACECVICNESIINSVITPCGHMWLCYECAYILKLGNKPCPACRQQIVSVVRVYKP